MEKQRGFVGRLYDSLAGRDLASMYSHVDESDWLNRIWRVAVIVGIFTIPFLILFLLLLVVGVLID